MKIIVNGCSFTNWVSAGNRRSTTWGNHLSDTRNEKVINLAKKGSTNQEIIDNTLVNINDNEEFIILMQLSGLDRILINGQRTPTVASHKKSSIFNWWNMSQNEPLTERWISYFKNDYSEENHLKSFLELLLKFQNEVKHKPNIRYRFFTGWDLFTKSDEEIDMWSDTTKYVNVNKPLVKDEYKSCKKLFDEIDFNSFWFFENENVQYGGMIQWVQYNLHPSYWYRDYEAGDFHPSDFAHKRFTDEVITPLIKELYND